MAEWVGEDFGLEQAVSDFSRAGEARTGATAHLTSILGTETLLARGRGIAAAGALPAGDPRREAVFGWLQAKARDAEALGYRQFLQRRELNELSGELRIGTFDQAELLEAGGMHLEGEGARESEGRARDTMIALREQNLISEAELKELGGLPEAELAGEVRKRLQGLSGLDRARLLPDGYPGRDEIVKSLEQAKPVYTNRIADISQDLTAAGTRNPGQLRKGSGPGGGQFFTLQSRVDDDAFLRLLGEKTRALIADNYRSHHAAKGKTGYGTGTLLRAIETGEITFERTKAGFKVQIHLASIEREAIEQPKGTWRSPANTSVYGPLIFQGRAGIASARPMFFQGYNGMNAGRMVKAMAVRPVAPEDGIMPTPEQLDRVIQDAIKEFGRSAGVAGTKGTEGT